jgi:tripartite-type tricarboxylate transporter receptor subunit TctC
MVRILEAPDDIGVGFYAASGIPSERVAALRKAFWEMMHDGKFLSDAARLEAPIAPVPADELHKIVAAIYATPPAVVERFKQVVK